MKKEGTIVRWDDARGFGFIRSAASGADVFFHVRDFRGAAGSTPRMGLAVTFEEIHVGGKGPRGMAVQAADLAASPAPAAAPRRPASPRSGRPENGNRKANTRTNTGSSAAIALLLMLAYAGGVVWGVWIGRLPWWVLPALPVLSVFTFFAYWQDKFAAQKGQWRIKEDTLHFWSLAGGWPGAWFAQQVLRHKSRKASFRETYWVTVVLHCVALGGWLWWLGSRSPL